MMGDRLLHIREVAAMTALSRATIYTMMRSGDFPRPLQVGPRAVRWRESQVRQWVDDRPVNKGDLRIGVWDVAGGSTD